MAIDSSRSHQVGAPSVFYEVAVRKLSDQLQSVDGLDAKAGNLFLFASGILAFFAVIVPLRLGSNKSFVVIHHVPISPRIVFLAVLGFSLALYIIAIHSLRLAYKINSQWEFRPTLAWLEEQSELWPDAEMRVLVAKQCKASWFHNQPRIVKKANRINTALNLVAGEAALASGPNGSHSAVYSLGPFFFIQSCSVPVLIE
jgi:hypothetical protein